MTAASCRRPELVQVPWITGDELRDRYSRVKGACQRGAPVKSLTIVCACDLANMTVGRPVDKLIRLIENTLGRRLRRKSRWTDPHPQGEGVARQQSAGRRNRLLLATAFLGSAYSALIPTVVAQAPADIAPETKQPTGSVPTIFLPCRLR